MVFNIPLFGVYLAREWLWYFSPSLSYVGQGKLHNAFASSHGTNSLLGIIMGFPTTLSMSLVSKSGVL